MTFPVEKPCGRDNKPETCTCTDGSSIDLAEIFSQRPKRPGKGKRPGKKEKPGKKEDSEEAEESEDAPVAEEKEEEKEEEKDFDTVLAAVLESKTCKDGSKPRCFGKKKQKC